ncbi:MAG TPA: endonuclease [Bacteroidales bacterium]|nr:endonuclease [Bacteroidales bacterium]
MIKRVYLSVFFFVLLYNQQAFSAIPAGYYNGADGFSGSALKTQLYNAIKVHTALTYSELWTAFRTTDVRADGKVWDIYSNATNFVFGTNQDSGSGGSAEGQFYNREHSFPKSWFADATPMYTDLFHLYPSDKWVNNQRGNMPFGNVQSVTGFSTNHYCEWGTSNESGTSLMVFEPADEMKGDFARTYFYMVTRYENLVASWKSNANTEMLSGNSYPALSSWAISVLLEWSRLDPVSAKERARNDIIYTNFQHNRNPYIDYPSLAEYVWGDSTTYAFHPSKYTFVPVVKSETPVFRVWAEHGYLHVQTAVGEVVEVLDLTGNVIERSIANQAESIIQTGMHRFVLVRIENQVQKVLL